MKKQYFSVLICLALVLGAFSPVLAETATGTKGNINSTTRANYEAQRVKMEAQRAKMRAEAETRKADAESKGDEVRARREAKSLELETRRAEMDTKREAKRVEAEAKRVEAQSKRVAFQEEAAKRQVENVTKVILATIGRLETNIIVRVESRIAKVKARGGVTTESEGFIAAAKVNLANAKAVVATFAGIDLSSEKARENFEKIRTAAKEAREHIRAAHQNLMMAVRSLGSVEVKIETDDSVE
ncbi:MAG: hypothetical protein Q7R69_00465 [bacterium]|nr:hypothetical protein [bacterium]